MGEGAAAGGSDALARLCEAAAAAVGALSPDTADDALLGDAVGTVNGLAGGWGAEGGVRDAAQRRALLGALGGALTRAAAAPGGGPFSDAAALAAAAALGTLAPTGEAGVDGSADFNAAVEALSAAALRAAAPGDPPTLLAVAAGAAGGGATRRLAAGGGDGGCGGGGGSAPLRLAFAFARLSPAGGGASVAAPGAACGGGGGVHFSAHLLAALGGALPARGAAGLDVTVASFTGGGAPMPTGGGARLWGGAFPAADATLARHGADTGVVSVTLRASGARGGALLPLAASNASDGYVYVITLPLLAGGGRGAEDVVGARVLEASGALGGAPLAPRRLRFTCPQLESAVAVGDALPAWGVDGSFAGAAAPPGGDFTLLVAAIAPAAPGAPPPRAPLAVLAAGGSLPATAAAAGNGGGSSPLAPLLAAAGGALLPFLPASLWDSLPPPSLGLPPPPRGGDADGALSRAGLLPPPPPPPGPPRVVTLLLPCGDRFGLPSAAPFNCTPAHAGEEVTAACPRLTPLGACTWWDGAAGAWSTAGCAPPVAAPGGGHISCACTHLTDFAGRWGAVGGGAGAVAALAGEALAGAPLPPWSPAPLATLASLLLLAALAACAGEALDVRAEDKFYAALAGNGDVQLAATLEGLKGRIFTLDRVKDGQWGMVSGGGALTQPPGCARTGSGGSGATASGDSTSAAAEGDGALLRANPALAASRRAVQPPQAEAPPPPPPPPPPPAGAPPSLAARIARGAKRLQTFGLSPAESTAIQELLLLPSGGDAPGAPGAPPPPPQQQQQQQEPPHRRRRQRSAPAPERNGGPNAFLCVLYLRAKQAYGGVTAAGLGPRAEEHMAALSGDRAPELRKGAPLLQLGGGGGGGARAPRDDDLLAPAAAAPAVALAQPSAALGALVELGVVVSDAGRGGAPSLPQQPRAAPSSSPPPPQRALPPRPAAARRRPASARPSRGLPPPPPPSGPRAGSSGSSGSSSPSGGRSPRRAPPRAPSLDEDGELWRALVAEEAAARGAAAAAAAASTTHGFAHPSTTHGFAHPAPPPPAPPPSPPAAHPPAVRELSDFSGGGTTTPTSGSDSAASGGGYGGRRGGLTPRELSFLRHVSHAAAALNKGGGAGTSCGRFRHVASALGGLAALRVYYRHPLVAPFAVFDPRASRASRILLLAVTSLVNMWAAAFLYAYRWGAAPPGGAPAAGWVAQLPALTLYEVALLGAAAAVLTLPAEWLLARALRGAGEAEFAWRYPSLAEELSRRAAADAALARVSSRAIAAELGVARGGGPGSGAGAGAAAEHGWVEPPPACLVRGRGGACCSGRRARAAYVARARAAEGAALAAAHGAAVGAGTGAFLGGDAPLCAALAACDVGLFVGALAVLTVRALAAGARALAAPFCGCAWRSARAPAGAGDAGPGEAPRGGAHPVALAAAAAPSAWRQRGALAHLAAARCCSADALLAGASACCCAWGGRAPPPPPKPFRAGCTAASAAAYTLAGALGGAAVLYVAFFCVLQGPDGARSFLLAWASSQMLALLLAVPLGQVADLLWALVILPAWAPYVAALPCVGAACVPAPYLAALRAKAAAAAPPRGAQQPARGPPPQPPDVLLPSLSAALSHAVTVAAPGAAMGLPPATALGALAPLPALACALDAAAARFGPDGGGDRRLRPHPAGSPAAVAPAPPARARSRRRRGPADDGDGGAHALPHFALAIPRGPLYSLPERGGRGEEEGQEEEEDEEEEGSRDVTPLPSRQELLARWYVRARLRAEMRPLWVAALRARRAALAATAAPPPHASPQRGAIPPPSRAVLPFDTAVDYPHKREVVTADSAAASTATAAEEELDGEAAPEEHVDAAAVALPAAPRRGAPLLHGRRAAPFLAPTGGALAEDAPPPPFQPWARDAPGGLLLIRELPSPPPQPRAAHHFSARADSRSPSNMLV